MFFRVPAAIALLVCSAAPLAAQQPVTLQFNDGRVTLMARNAPIRAVLAEWARLGGATIVNGERVVGPPVTLELTGVPERQALDILLRSVAGYMLAPRPSGSTGGSAFDRILILPTSVAPRNPPPTPAAAAQRRVFPQRPPAVVAPPEDFPVGVMEGFPQDPALEEEQFQPDQMPVVRPGMPRVGAPRTVVVPPQPRGIEAGVITFDGDESQSEPQQDPGVAPTPSNPFGIPFGSSQTPGVVTPVPEPQPADGIQ